MHFSRNFSSWLFDALSHFGTNMSLDQKIDKTDWDMKL